MPGSQWQRNHGAVSFFFSTEEFDREGLHGQLLMFMPFRVLGYVDDTGRVYMANCLCSCLFVYLAMLMIPGGFTWPIACVHTLSCT